MNSPLARALLAVAAASLVFAAPLTAQEIDNPDIATLRCAAGYGCQSQCEAQRALGVENSESAKNRYALDHPAAYIKDVQDLGGRPPETCAESVARDEDNMAGEGVREEASNAETPVNPSCHLNDEGEWINCEAGGSGGGSAANGGSPDFAGRDLPDFTEWEGYSEQPCPGRLFEDPRHPIAPSMRMLTCFSGADGAFTECGLTPARSFCLMNGSIEALCYGVTTAPAAATVDAVCETGTCPAFSYIVCR